MTVWSKQLPRIFGENASRAFLIDAIDGGQTSYADLARSAASLAVQLENLGVLPGDRIGIHLPNGSLFAILYFACLLGGFTAVPINNALSPKDRAFVLRRARLSAVVTRVGKEGLADLISERENNVSEIYRILTISKSESDANLCLTAEPNADIEKRLAGIDNDSLFSIHFTSGTTSLPKGVVHRVGALLDNAETFNRSFGINQDNRFVHVMPMPYMAGFLNTLLGALTAESCIILAPQFGPQSALRFWEPVAAHGGDTIWMSPTMLATLTRVDRGYVGVELCRTRHMRIFSATAPLTRKIQQEFELKYGVKVVESYGLSELLLVTANEGPAGSKASSVGTILPEVEVKILDDESRPVILGCDGAIIVNTPHATVGYLDFETGSPVPLVDRWFDTGDVGHIDADGYLFVTGRVKDLIIRGGFNVSPRQIEEALSRHPAVEDVAVVGAPHDFYGEQIVAAVVLAAGNSLEDIQASLRENCLSELGTSSVPDRFVAFEAFPMTNLGKIQKNKVREIIFRAGADMKAVVGEYLPKRAIRLRARNCESCRGDDVEQLWRQSFTARTRSGHYRFDVNNVICKNCGFVFVSPVFDEADLADYYTDAFDSFKGAPLDYDVDKRLAFLKEVAPKGAVFVEVGANQPTEFHRRLRSIYEKIATIEVNNSVSSDFKSFEDLRDECADVVAHYFVLEHVPRVVEFLKNCYRILRHGGVMVCEVPDIQVYPGDPTALLLYEHTNHFSKHILCKIASQVGFAQLKIDASLCSRPFGFAVAFHKSDSRDKRSFPSEYRKNRQLFNEGVKQLERLQDDMEHAGGKLKTYEHHNETVIFWGANDLMARFLDQYPLFENVTIVDSNIEKIDFMPGATVFTPSAAAVKIRKADAIFIFTRLHAAEILSQIELSIGKKFKPENVHVVDPFGGVLPRCV